MTAVMKLGQRGFACTETTLAASRAIGIRQGTEWIALEAARALKLDIATVDVVVEGGRIRVSNACGAPDVELLEAIATLDVCAMVVEYATIRAGRWSKRVGGGNAGHRDPARDSVRPDTATRYTPVAPAVLLSLVSFCVRVHGAFCGEIGCLCLFRDC